jgi:hypothetical protein
MLDIQVGMETEGFAIYDSMMQLKNEVGFSSKIVLASLSSRALNG